MAGHRAWYFKEQGSSYLVVDLGGGIQLKVEVGPGSQGHAPSSDVLASIVESTDVDRSSLQWLGARGLVD